MNLRIQATGTPAALLADDASRPENQLVDHPVWRDVFAGTMQKQKVKRLLLALLPALAGPGRYAFAAKISQIDAADGKALFMQVHGALKDAAVNADAGWRRVLGALGATDREIRAAIAQPSAEAADLVDVIQEHGLRTSATEAAVVAFMLERHLPALWGRLATALEKHYGATREATAYLRHEAKREPDVRAWVDHLVQKYVSEADGYKVYEARRAGREAVWAWTVLVESVD